MAILFKFRGYCLLIIIISITFIPTGCTERSQSSPEGYNLRHAKSFELGKELVEISGIAYNEEDTSLLAISDNKEKIYKIDLKTKKLKNYTDKFAGVYDYEDIVKVKDSAYVLISNGTIIAVPKNAKDSTATVRYKFWSQARNDFETIYHDPSVNALIMICKTCEHEKGEEIRTAYKFDLATRSFDSSEYYIISIGSVKAKVRNDDANFKPSAAAIHPINKNLYILASAGQLLVITDLKGTVLQVFSLHPDRHPQAEGIAFAPDGTMFISNEGKYGKATLQIFAYKPLPVKAQKK
jgi:uncharacterized protein YjiK